MDESQDVIRHNQLTRQQLLEPRLDEVGLSLDLNHQRLTLMCRGQNDRERRTNRAKDVRVAQDGPINLRMAAKDVVRIEVTRELRGTLLPTQGIQVSRVVSNLQRRP